MPLLAAAALAALVQGPAAGPPQPIAGPPSVALAPLAGAAVGAGCGREIDPQFVLYVPPAPSSGRNPLLRLISGGAPPAVATRRAAPGFCGELLTRGAAHR